MAGQSVRAFPPAVVIAGMHRSGTSLTASLLAAAGVHLGDDLMPAAASNPRGHFEDFEFHHLHQRILASNGLSLEGFSCEETIAVPAQPRVEAAELVHRRRAGDRPWGWKDPRTILFLDFWAELVPEARWLFVVRPPEEVVDSLFRRGDTAFVFNPRHAVDVWVAYNRRILEFVRRHQDRCLVRDLAQVIADPAGLVAAVAALLDTALGPPGQRYEPELLKRGQPARRAGLVRAVRPDAHELYRDLLQLAGADDQAGNQILPAAATAEAGLAEWAMGCRALAEQGFSATREANARRAHEQAERALVAEQAARAEAISQGTAIAADLARLQAGCAEEARGRAAAEARCGELEQEIARLDAACGGLAARCETLAAQAAEATATLAMMQADATETRVGHERERAEARRQLAEARSLAERHERAIEALARERDDLVAQLEGERTIHESLRRDMTGRIEAALTGLGGSPG